MTQEEAKQELHNGNNITHKYFTSDEHITPKFKFEDGVKVPLDWWNKDFLQDGWSIYKDR